MSLANAARMCALWMDSDRPVRLGGGGTDELPLADRPNNELQMVQPAPKKGTSQVLNPKLKMNPWQASVVNRVTARCRKQKSFLLYHRMGAGKTISMLMIMHNIPTTVRRVIFAPRSILLDTYNENGDLRIIYKDKEVVNKRARDFELYPIDGDPVEHNGNMYYSFVELLKTGQLIDVCKGAFVGIDEIHNLVPYLKNSRALNTMRQAMSGALRIVGMTGTPIVHHVSDLTVIMSILIPEQGRGKIPVTDTTFKSKYYIETEKDKENAAWDMSYLFGAARTGAIVTSELGSFAFMNNIITLVLSAAVFGGGGVAAYLGQFAAKVALGGLVYTKTMNFFQTAVKGILERIRQQDYESLNQRALIQDYQHMISFFDYKIEDSVRWKFPDKVLVEIQSPYTLYQMHMLIRMMGNKSLFGEYHSTILGMDEGEDIADINQVFLKYVSRVGDLSPDHEDYSVKWKWTELKDGEVVEMRADDFKPDASEKIVCVAEPKDASKPKDAVPNGVFSCPKFLDALSILNRYYTMDTPHVQHNKDTYAQWKEKQEAKLQAEDLRAVGHVPQCPKMNMEGSKPKLAQPILLKHKKGHFIPNGENGKRFLPIVYCSYETTMMEFSAFLSSQNLEHYVFHGKDSPGRRSLLKKLVAGTQYDIGKGPFCAILHPSIIEGLSLTWNPCLIALDNIRGYGIQEQVYGRVLRNLQFVDDFENKYKKYVTQGRDESWRIHKYIYQLRSYYPQEQTWGQWFKRFRLAKLGGKIWSKLDIYETEGEQGTLEQYKASILRTDARLSETDVKTLSTVRPQDDLRGFVSESKRQDVKQATARERAIMYNRGTGGMLDWRTAWANTATFMSPEFEVTRWRIISSSPDQLVMAENGKQAMVLHALAKAFSQKKDNDIADKFCDDEPTCKPNLSVDDSSHTCSIIPLEGANALEDQKAAIRLVRRERQRVKRQNDRAKKSECPCVEEKAPGECFVTTLGSTMPKGCEPLKTAGVVKQAGMFSGRKWYRDCKPGSDASCAPKTPET